MTLGWCEEMGTRGPEVSGQYWWDHPQPLEWRSCRPDLWLHDETMSVICRTEKGDVTLGEGGDDVM